MTGKHQYISVGISMSRGIWYIHIQVYRKDFIWDPSCYFCIWLPVFHFLLWLDLLDIVLRYYVILPRFCGSIKSPFLTGTCDLDWQHCNSRLKVKISKDESCFLLCYEFFVYSAEETGSLAKTNYFKSLTSMYLSTK